MAGERSLAWAAWALLATFSFGTNNFLLDAVAEEANDPSAANLSAIVVVWATAGAMGVVALIRSAGTTGAMQGIGGPICAALAAGAGAVSGGGTLCLTLAIASDPANAGPITAMLPLNSLLVSLLAWVVVGEVLRPVHLLGMAVAAAGPACMAAADSSSNALQGVGLGLLTAVCFGVSNFLRKLAMTKGATSAQDVACCFFLAVFVMSAIMLVVFYVCGRGLQGLDTLRLATYAIVSGLLWASGSVFFQFALSGLAGPVAAITNTNSVWVLVLSMVFYHTSPAPLKLAGMALCIVGATILSLAPKPMARICSTREASSLSMHGVSLRTDSQGCSDRA